MAEERQGHGGGSKNHGLPLGEATPEERKRWREQLEESGKYNEGASLKELIAKRDAPKSTAVDDI